MVELMVTEQELGINMTQMRNRLGKTSIWMLMLLFPLVACFPALLTKQVVSSTTIQELGKLGTPFMASATLARSTITPTSTSVPTNTPTLSSTPTRSIQPPTPTLVPTLSDTQTEALVLDLLHNNADCKLPCWWGLTPGKTDWTTIQSRISSLGLPFSTYPRSEYDIFGTGFYLTNHSFSVGPLLFLQNDTLRVIKAIAETTPGPDQRIYGDPFYLEAMRPYLLTGMLSTYGKPEQALLYVLDTRDPVLSDYFMLLFFPLTGILAQYEGQSEEGNGVLRLCPQTAMISMWLWSPDEKMTLADVFSFEVYTSKDVQMKFLDRFLPLEDAASISIEDFYTQFSSQQKSCLETPKSLWNR